jgi:hypothetical protein
MFNTLCFVCAGAGVGALAMLWTVRGALKARR